MWEVFRIRNLLLTIAFRGTAYHGFQVQPNGLRTVCSTFQDAVEKVLGERLPVKGASRTDAGVHANGFAIGLSCPTAIPCDALVRALNVNLPGAIAVLDCR
jgi:tRNA pseudouridine38-40 synthase